MEGAEIAGVAAVGRTEAADYSFEEHNSDDSFEQRGEQGAGADALVVAEGAADTAAAALAVGVAAAHVPIEGEAGYL